MDVGLRNPGLLLRIAYVAVAGLALVSSTACRDEKPSAAASTQYRMGIGEEPATLNFFSYYGGPGSTVWTGYVLEGVTTSLYTYSHQRNDWVPRAAQGMPSPFQPISYQGQQLWASEVSLKPDLRWSDGEALTAEDFVFVVQTILELELGGNAAADVDPERVHHVEALDPHTIRAYFYPAPQGGPPGLGAWQFGLAFTPILPAHYWGPVVEQARQQEGLEAQRAALFAHVPQDQPTAGGFVLGQWEPGAFIEKERDPGWPRSNTQVLAYANGAYREREESRGYDVTYFGEAQGEVELSLTVGPHYDTALFRVYPDQEAGFLALSAGEVDYLFAPQGLQAGFVERAQESPSLAVVENRASSVRYLGFNVRQPPLSIPEFRRAVALLIDREFLTDQVLRGAAAPAYSLVVPGNRFWHHPDLPQPGKGLSRAQRVQQAVALLKSAGFGYQQEPVLSADGGYVAQPGQGLTLPSGEAMPELQLLSPAEGYDPLRATFAVWIGRWLEEVGVPVRVRLVGFDALVERLFAEPEGLDMWVMGWSLPLFPDYLRDYFHSDNAQGGFNFGGYADPEYDALADRLLAAQSLEEAQQVAYALQEHLAQDLPYVTLFSPTVADVYRADRVRYPYTQMLGGIHFHHGLQTTALIE